ncbi:MAG: transposase [Moorea sp. SIO4A1]|uniref:helix-turn-helix domain-containing protein n=1 Tax=Moorena sp. SIO4A1 TaxID=2607835 RepID=UPI0013B607F1|nr:helix-turn-helix domain-containing protein [Moorena sp. SIO4A1]NEQ57659.1 transposase [Moorena sp. SIO4A1]NEQ86101.1 transposase [Moorena sp. SIO2I5]
MTLEELIASNRDPRELKRAIAVKMRLQGLKHREIKPVLGVHSSYISRWERRYREQGVKGLELAYKGSSGYLKHSQLTEVIQWIKSKTQTSVWEVMDYIEQSYGVVYCSLQSYYELLKKAGMSWHKGKKKVPDTIALWWRNTTR